MWEFFERRNLMWIKTWNLNAFLCISCIVQSNLRYYNDAISGIYWWISAARGEWRGSVWRHSRSLGSMVWSTAAESMQFFPFFRTQIGHIHSIECENTGTCLEKIKDCSKRVRKLENKTLRWDISSGEKSTTMAAWQVFESCFPQALSVFDYRGSNCREKFAWFQIHTTILEKIDFPLTKNEKKPVVYSFKPTHVSFLVSSLRKWDKRVENRWWRHWSIGGSTVYAK